MAGGPGDGGGHGHGLEVGQLVPLRVGHEQEGQGLDLNAHGEEAYNNEFTG